MASGYGNHGGITRCFPFWQDVMACYVLNTTQESDAGKIKCRGYREDYYECLHHTKEIEKVARINEAIRRYQMGLGHAKDNAELASLGLVKGSYDPKKTDLRPDSVWKN
ncbi:hypothetical protein Dda_6401 [Drechslerella dactyloides]|uniref:NADH dehydrogenase [ubiquinone] iron-sulfur protein 5 n=1 Tax=Drechslerella dactyloides TaxID=74499 RepID=A0AAD6IX64_DREDA|nr:hypothetical protein Dda_6401 [Drechslerella dactyloides]